MTAEEIEKELGTKCGWCLGYRMEMSEIWCWACGGSGMQQTCGNGYYSRTPRTDPPPYLLGFNSPLWLSEMEMCSDDS